jgi:glyoxylase-like metal-dependent hydrolase (beta-lactamase superfamily II)
MTARIDHAITTGTFSSDGQTFPLDNNVWVLGDDSECIVIDAPHDVDTIAEVVGQRRVVAIVCTHAHNDHVGFAPKLSQRLSAPVWLHPADTELWALTHPVAQPDADLADGQVIRVAGIDVTVIHTPGHTPGAVSLYVPELGVVFSGDTLFEGGPGATGRSFSSFPTIIDSIRTRLLTLPPETRVLTGHGAETTIGAEAPALPDWIARGH